MKKTIITLAMLFVLLPVTVQAGEVFCLEHQGGGQFQLVDSGTEMEQELRSPCLDLLRMAVDAERRWLETKNAFVKAVMGDQVSRLVYEMQSVCH